MRRTLLMTALAACTALAAPLTAVQAQGKITIGVSLPQDDNPFYIR